MKYLRRGVLFIFVLVLICCVSSAWEMTTGQRLYPWSAYWYCGTTKPQGLPATVRVGFYEEFPSDERLAKLDKVDFPVTLAIAASSRAQFDMLSRKIRERYGDKVRAIYFWPLLSHEEGYYPGIGSDNRALRRVAEEASGLPVLWDLEWPLFTKNISLQSMPSNRAFLSEWMNRDKPVHIWRTHTTMGLNPFLLQLTGMHFDPLDYPSVSIHLDLYKKGEALSDGEMARILRCGVEQYEGRFIPSLGVLNDGLGPENVFISPELLKRDLRLARAAGAQEVWLFGLNGLNDDYLAVLHETLPLETLQAGGR